MIGLPPERVIGFTGMRTDTRGPPENTKSESSERRCFAVAVRTAVTGISRRQPTTISTLVARCMVRAVVAVTSGSGTRRLAGADARHATTSGRFKVGGGLRTRPRSGPHRILDI